MSDGEMVRQALAGQVDAYGELARRWAARILALCHARVGCAAAAEDLAQETLLRGFRSLGSLLEPERFGPWLRGIAVRTCLDWLKTRQRTPVVFSALGHDRELGDFVPAAPSATSDHEDDLRQLISAVEALPEVYRTVVLLYYYEDVTHRELGQLLGVSAATINARLTQARALLRERLSACRP